MFNEVAIDQNFAKFTGGLDNVRCDIYDLYKIKHIKFLISGIKVKYNLQSKFKQNYYIVIFLKFDYNIFIILKLNLIKL